MLARAGIVIAIEIIAIFGQHEFGAVAVGMNLDRRLGDGNLLLVHENIGAVDDASGLTRAWRNDVAIDTVEARDHAGIPFSGEGFAPALAEIEAAADRRPVRTAAEPGVLFLLIGEGLENPCGAGLPVTGDGETGMDHGSFHFQLGLPYSPLT